MTAKDRRRLKRLTQTSIIKVLAVALGVSLAACGTHGQDGHASAEGQKEEAHAHDGVTVFTTHQADLAGVKTEVAEERPFEQVIRCSGEILSAQGEERTVTSPLAGTVSFIGAPPVPGMPVGSGQRLFAISARHIVQPDASGELRAALANAQANLRRAKEQYEERLITKAEYDQAEAEVKSARAALSNPGASPVKEGSASSPISGYVTECLVQPGDYVEIGAPLARVSADRHLQLRAQVPQRYAPLLPYITGANALLPQGPQDRLSLGEMNGRVVSYGKGSAGSLYIPVVMEFDNPGGLVSGTVAEVYLLAGKGASTVVLPREALTEEEGQHFVYVEQSPEHYVKRRVEVSGDNGKEVAVSSGLKAGERVVTKGAVTLKLAANSGKAPQGHSHNH